MLRKLFTAAALLLSLTVGAIGAVDFPNSPSDKQTYTFGNQTWIYSSTSGAWSVLGLGTGTGTGLSVTKQIFTSGTAATYTPSTGMVYAKVTVTGGGAGGGGADASSATASGGGAGGGEGGGTAIKWYTAAEMGATATYTVGGASTAGSGTSGTQGGDGNDSTFDPAGTGPTLTGAGGNGGAGCNPGANTICSGAGGDTEGTATNGDVNITAGPGSTGTGGGAATGSSMGGTGGSSIFGNGGKGGGTTGAAGSSAGTNAVVPGTGGGGAAVTLSTTGAAGGTGTAGMIVVEEYVMNGTVSLDINSMTALAAGSLDGVNDQIAVFDNSAGYTKKMAAGDFGMVTLGVGTFSGASSVDFVIPNNTSWKAIILYINADFSTDAVGWLRTDSDGGASYDAGGSDYAIAAGGMFGDDPPFGFSNVATTEFDGCAFEGSTADRPTGYEITLYNPGAATQHVMVKKEAGGDTGSALYGACYLTGGRLSSTDIDAVRFLPSTGTVTGSYTVYGVK